MLPIVLADISGEGLVGALIWIVCMGLIVWLLHWLITYINLPEPWAKVARVLLALFAVIVLIDIIMGVGGHGFISWRD